MVHFELWCSLFLHFEKASKKFEPKHIQHLGSIIF